MVGWLIIDRFDRWDSRKESLFIIVSAAGVEPENTLGETLYSSKSQDH